MLSIRLRIVLIALLSIGVVALLIHHEYSVINKDLENSTASLQVVNEVTTLSELIHPLQKERGLTATLLVKHADALQEKLEKQRQISDIHLKKTIHFFKASKAGDFLALQEQIVQIRGKFDSGEATWREVKNVYSDGIEMLLTRMSVLLSELEHSKSVTHQLYALIHLAKARENMGLLRANMSRYYQRGEITRKELLDISNYYGIFSEELSRFRFQMKQTQWNNSLQSNVLFAVRNQILQVLNNAQIDDSHLFENSVSTWWSESTQVIDAMKNLENAILKEVQTYSDQKIETDQKHLLTFIFLAIITMITIIMLTIITVFRILQALSILIRSMNKVEETQNFGVRIKANANDEFGQLGVSINRLLDYTDRVIQEKERLASIDLLTELMNRRSFLQAVEREIARSRRYNTPLSLIFCDIDKFKSINDQFGHAVGDQTLQMFANLLKSKTRKSDYVARWGGEEFVILATETNLSQASMLAEKLRKDADALDIPTVGHMTCSFGASELLESDSFEKLCDRADQAVYHAKQLGRNQVYAIDQ